MAPRIMPRRSSLQEYRRAIEEDGSAADPETTAFWRWVTTPAIGHDPLEFASREEQRVLSKASSGGGFLVPDDVANQVVAAIRAESVMARLALEFVTGEGAVLGVPVGATHGTAAWVSESASYTASDETITVQNLSAFKAGTKIIVSEELLRDSAVDVDAYLAAELGSRLGALEEVAFTAGDGAGKPLGITAATSGYATVAASGVGETLVLKWASFKAVYDALPAQYRAGASWIMHPNAFSGLAGTVDTAGSPVWNTATLFGAPVYLNPAMPAPAASAKSVAFGNWKLAYAVRRVQGVSLQRQGELHSDSGQIGYRAFERVDGRPTLTDAARLLQQSAT